LAEVGLYKYVKLGWPDVDEHISVEGMLNGTPVPSLTHPVPRGGANPLTI
jgi:hypothetical protein